MTLQTLALAVALPATAQTNLYISEFMASNNRILADQDNEFSDWIEIHNPTANSISLEGWSLSDNGSNWRFPATNIGPGQFLVVFASNKNRRVPGAELHTNFRLNADGEYLALIMPDGVTLASVFPLYPPQALNVSYGFGVLTTNQTLIDSNSPVRVRVPANAGDGTNWAYLGFNDAGWTAGTNGVGFGSTNVVAADYGAAVQATQPVGYWRLDESSGTVAANRGSGLGLNASYTSITLGTAGPRPPSFNGFEANNNAPTFNGSSSYASVPNSLLSGRSAFTIGGWIRPAATPGSRIGLFGQNDCVEFGFISGTTMQCWTPGGGSLDVAYPFAMGAWHHVVAVGDGTSLRIYLDGVLRGTGGTTTANYGSSGSPFNIGGGGIYDVSGNFFNGQIDEVVVYHRALSATEITNLYGAGLVASGGSVVPYVRTDIGPVMSNLNASAYLRLPFVVGDPTNVALLRLNLRYNDGFAAYLNGVELLRVNAPTSLTYNSSAPQSHTTLSMEEFRLGPQTLVPGPNLLAIHGLNVAVTNADFLIQAELIAASAESFSTNPVYFTLPTPGEPNAVGVPIPGPAVVELSHSPNTPTQTQDLTVTAQVFPTFHGLSNVVMRYRTMFQPEIEAPMYDDGLHGDGAAGDGTYGAIIPSGAGTNGQMIRWYFRATDTNGLASRWPLFLDPTGAEYLGTVVNPGYVTSKLPIIHLFAPTNILQPGPPTQQIGADSQSGARGVSVFYDGELYDNVYVSLRGNTTAGYTKKSHRFEFNRNHPFRHLPQYPRINKTSFVADYPDPSYMRQGLAFWLCNQLGNPAPFYYPIRFQLNGQFYQLANHNDVHADDLLDRLGYDPNGALYNAAGTVVPGRFSTGGFEKKTRRGDGDADYAQLAASVAESLSLETRRTNIFDLFDIPNAINYLVAARWSHENDDVWANMSLYHDNDGDDMWRIIGFDMNLAWGAIFYEGGNPSVIEGVQSTNDIHKAHPLYGTSQATALSGPGAPNNYNRVYEAFFLVPQTRQMYLRRLRTMLDTYVKPPGAAPYSTGLEQMIIAWRDSIAEEANRDRAKWGWPAKGGQCNFNPGIDITNGVRGIIEEFIWPRRRHFYGKHSVTNTALPIGVTKDQNAGIPLPQPPAATLVFAGVEYNPASGNQAQEFICLSNPTPFALEISGWTLDRGVEFTFAPGTVVPSNSAIYVSPDVRAFKARTTGPRGGQGLFVVGPYRGQLSARGEGLRLLNEFGTVLATNAYAPAPTVAQQYLRVTELMYHPERPSTGTLAADDYEYIELKNIGPTTLNLSGVRLVNGVEFNFTGSAVTSLAAGARVLVVANSNAFVLRYGSGRPVAGTYTGRLENGGERIQLLDSGGEEVLDFNYNNSWYPITDGHGFSLVIVNEAADPDFWNRASNWRPSGQLNGSPGLDDPAPPAFGPVLITEALTRTDFPPPTDTIEIYNPSNTTANLGGWFLSDDFNTPKKYRIANGTILAGGSYLKFTEADFNPVPGATNSFALSSLGDEVYLFSGDAETNLTGYVHGFNFGAAENGVTFGRYLTSENKEEFVAQRAETLGTNNAGPKVGPIVIGELNYRPPDVGTNDNTDDEFIELVNISTTNVFLYDPTASTNTWKITGGVDYIFPTNRSLAAGEYLLLVNFDPVTNAAALAAFQAKYGVSPGVQVLGPYGGKLNNDQDDVELKKPTTPTTNEVPYVLVDEVEYEDSLPWPQGADGDGLSLQRRNLQAYGNDPTNWVAAAPTAAGPLASGGTVPTIVQPPQSQTGVGQGNVTFTVTAAGSAPLSYQWRLNGAPIFGATNSLLILTNLQPSQAGDYDVLVFNPYGSVVSTNATLSLIYPPMLLLNPANVAVRIRPDPAAAPTTNATFSVSAYSFAPPLSYQWRFNGMPIPGATGPSYTVTNVQIADEGFYDVIVGDTVASFTSAPALLTPLITPIFTQVPIAQSVVVGSPVTLSAQATGHPLPFTFEWRRGSTILATTVTNRRYDFFTFIAPTNPGFADYRVVIKNQAFSVPGIASPLIRVTYLADADRDGIPDVWESQFGFSPTNNADRNLDFDLDGASNWEEYVAGTDPTIAASVLRVDIQRGGGQVAVSFEAISNRTYSVLASDQIAGGVWASLAEVIARTSNHVETFIDTTSQTNRFYQVVTPRQ